MTALKAPKIRPVSTVFDIEWVDDAGRVIHYLLHVEARRVTVWTDTQDGGSLTIPELYSLCCIAKARTETNDR